MKKTVIILILLISSVSTSLAINNSKILVNEDWQYAAGETIFNETSLETIQFVTEDNVIPLSKVNTIRKTENDFIFSKTIISSSVNFSIDIDLKGDQDWLYVTQVGGFPIFNSISATGSANYSWTLDNSSGSFEKNIDLPFENQLITTTFGGDISNAFLTGSSEILKFIRIISQNGGDTFLKFERIGVLSTDQDIISSEVNFTLSWISTELDIQIESTMNRFNMLRTQFSTNYRVHVASGVSFDFERADTVPVAQLYAYRDISKLPVYVRQTEAATLELNNKLQLNGDELENPKKIVEYNLIVEEETTTTSVSTDTSSVSTQESQTEETYFMFSFFSFIAVIYLISRKRY